VADIPVEQNPPMPRRKLLWLELLVITSVVYLPTAFSQLEPSITPPADPTFVVYRLLTALGRCAIILFTVWVADGSLSSLGLRKPNWKLDAIVTGCLALLVIAIAYVPLNFISPAARHWGSQARSPSLTFAAQDISLTLILVTLAFTVSLEELFSRGYLVSRLREIFGNYWKPIIISSIIFGSVHIYQGAYGACIATLLGVVFALSFAVTERLWPSLIVHYAFDAFLIVRYSMLVHSWHG
jgi:membrane protease YdiL (CAAX protease family)